MYSGEGRPARSTGAYRKENVGMSNDKGNGNSPADNPRVPEQRYTDQGKPGAKPKPRGAGDAQAVKIPLPALQSEMGPGSGPAAV